MARRSRRRNDYRWIGATGGAAMASGASSALVTVISTQSAFTLMRIRGEAVASIDGPVANDKVIVAIGLIIVTDAAVAAGAASIPTPATDLNSSWIWHGFFPLVAQGADDAEGVVMRQTIDSKAMRKIGNLESMVVVAENVALAGTPAVDIAWGVRCLFAS